MARLSPGQLLQKAAAYHREGNLGAAASRYQEVLKDNPNNYDAQRLLGVVAYQRKNYDSAERMLRKALTLNPAIADAHYFLGRVLADSGKEQDAITAFQNCLARDANHLNAVVALAVLSEATGDLEGAYKALTKVLSASPRTSDLLFRRGNVAAKAGLLDDALADFNAALAVDPKGAGVLTARAAVLMRMGRYAEAIPDLEKSVALDPKLSDGGVALLHCRMQIAEWGDLARASEALLEGLRNGQWTPSPTVLMSLPATSGDLRRAAERYIAAQVPTPAPARAPLWQGERYAHTPIRLGYLSCDLRDHAVGYLMAGVFEKHDHAQFEMVAFATTPLRDTPMAKRLHSAFSDYVDISSVPDDAAARLIREREIDILVDLTGLTGAARPGILAARPVPVQVNFLGFAGTMGASYVDYIIADGVVIPESDEAFFAEKVVRMPDCFMPTDDTRAIAQVPSRAEAGLPETGFVFCGFNNIYKITPDIFDVWMRLLSSVPGSVLWLQQGYPVAADNFRREAQARGIDPLRLIFAPRVAGNEDHLARQAVADLFLDTLPYNAHSTTADALWAGLPVLTCAGQTFAGRVAASLLQTCGLNELVTHSLADYEAKALSLAKDPAGLARVKARVGAARQSSRLFDTAGYTRNLEKAFAAMVTRARAGEPPSSLTIA